MLFVNSRRSQKLHEQILLNVVTAEKLATEINYY